MSADSRRMQKGKAIKVQDLITPPAGTGHRKITADFILKRFEEGRFFRDVLFSILFLTVAAALIAGIDFTTREVTKIYDDTENRQYHIKKVSHIPEEKKKEEAEKKAVEDDKITAGEIKNRYLSYLISKIESNKRYPIVEQKKGHEGEVLLKLFIKKDGTIEKVQILSQARHRKLTQAAVEAIRKSLPLKPVPDAIEEDRIVVKLSIQFFLE